MCNSLRKTIHTKVTLGDNPQKQSAIPYCRRVLARDSLAADSGRDAQRCDAICVTDFAICQKMSDTIWHAKAKRLAFS